METKVEYYIRCLTGELARRCEKNKSYSLRAFAKSCNVSPAALSQLISGKRVPSYKMAQKIMDHLGLPPTEREEFLSSLAKKHQKRTLQRLNPVFRKKQKEFAAKEISIDLFKVIGDWYHYALLMLVCVNDFRPSHKWMASQLGISELEAKLGMTRLVEVGLLKKDGDTYSVTNEHFTTADKHLTNAALKRHTKQSLEKAIESVDNDPIDVRSMSYMTMAIDEDKIGEAKLLIEEFTNKMSALLESGKRTRVYEFGVYLYPLQKK